VRGGSLPDRTHGGTGKVQGNELKCHIQCISFHVSVADKSIDDWITGSVHLVA
jgi:hypothetical protein